MATRRIGEVLREETIGGALLLAAAVVALAWANSPWWASYEWLRTLATSPASLPCAAVSTAAREPV